MIRAVLASIILLHASFVLAKVRVSVPFSNHMVLQRDVKVPVWGEADPGENVTVTFADKNYTTITDASGNWKVQLDAMPASGEPQTLNIVGSNKLAIENVVVGDVWIVAGDASLQVPLPESSDADNELPIANYPLLRAITPFPSHQPRQPAKQFRGGDWTPCFPQTANFAALAYYFGRDVRQSLDVPIGLIILAQHATAESWCSPEELDKQPATKKYADSWRWVDSKYKAIPNDESKMIASATGAPVAVREYRENYQKWLRASAKNRIAGKPISEEFPLEFQYFPAWRCPTPFSTNERPGMSFNVMISPLVPFAIKGVVWHHGIANMDCRDPGKYRDSMEALISDWRNRWKQKDLPVILSQLHSGGGISPTEPIQNIWAVLREQQTKLQTSMKNVWTAVTYDTTQAHTEDWRVSVNKGPVGRRMAALALKHVYGKDIHAGSPEFESMIVEGHEVRVRFKSEKGLAAALRTLPPNAVYSATTNSEVKGFAIAGEDHNWYWADGRIDGDTVIVWSDKVKKPVAVRYAWTDYTFANLTDSEGWPAAPFRTDDWRLERGF